MSDKRVWSFIATTIIIAAGLITACQDEPDKARPATVEVHSSTRPVQEVAVKETINVEVTRIIVETKVVEVPPETTVEVAEPTQLVICLGQDPGSLYPYDSARPDKATTHVRQAIYENLYTTLSYDYQARGLEKLPDLADGDAFIRSVSVSEGDKVYDIYGDVVSLANGMTVKTGSGENVTFDGTPLQMAQLVVNFSLKPLVWSDGMPVTAADSVYSFKLAADPATPLPKTAIERTVAYEAIGERTLQWTGVPGYMDPTYFTNVWMPLPLHAWGQYSAADLLNAELATTTPLSTGPYVVAEWLPGDHLTLEKNEHYYLAGQALPKVDTIRFNFIPTPGQVLAQLLSGECDIGTHDALSVRESPSLIEAEQNGTLVPFFQDGSVFEHIDFGIRSAGDYLTSRADWFKDPRVRQAFVMCINRQAVVDDYLYGRARIMHTYVPGDHPLYPNDAVEWPYDVEAANRLLDETGYLDWDEDGLREDPRLGGRFKVTLLGALGNDLGQQVAESVQEDLAQCGIEVELRFLDNDVYFADGPDGPLFGRQFDLGAFPWLISIEPNCSLYLSDRIPGPENGWNRSYNNETGFSDPAFDEACNQALASLPGMAEHDPAHREALRIFSEQVPVIPLFMRLKVAAIRPEVQNFTLDATQESELWNIYELYVE